MRTTDHSWMIYGATGRSGQLIARRAVAQGLRPILAGRDAKALQQIADELSLSWRAFAVNDWEVFGREVSKINLLVNAAGPFMETSVLIAELCLAAHTNYFDLSNEVPSLVAAYTLDPQAREKNLTLLPGLAFSPTASNCLVQHLHSLFPDADSLVIALEPFMRTPILGANLTIVESVTGGGFRRRGGILERCRIGSSLPQVALPSGVRTLLPAALADVEAAYRCTSVPNISIHLAADLSALPPRGEGATNARAMRSIKTELEAGAENNGDNYLNGGRSLVWARFSKGGQSCLEGWLRVGEGSEFTAEVVMAGVTRLLDGRRLSAGALTPAMAFGADFILSLANVDRTVQPLTRMTSERGTT